MKFLSLRDQLLKNRREAEATNARQVESEIVNSITFVALAQAGVIDEVTAAEHIELFSEWQPNVNYSIGALVAYEDNLYKCVQTHTSQETWRPTVAESLWAKAGDPNVEYPKWSQPVGAHDAYMSEDKVYHNDKKWISAVDNNIWEPGIYGWNEVA